MKICAPDNIGPRQFLYPDSNAAGCASQSDFLLQQLLPVGLPSI